MKNSLIVSFSFLIACIFFIPIQASVQVNNDKTVRSKTKNSSHGVHYKVFIMSGQSNMVGVAANAAFPTIYQAEQTNVQIWAGMQIDASLTNQWLNVKPGFGAILAASGSELSFAKEISTRLPTDNIRIIKGASAATSIAEYWLSPTAGVPSKEDYYHLLLNSIVQPALNNITANGDTYEIAGFLWMQGESDAIVQSMANAYESNLSNFIKDIRNDLGVEKLPFIIAKIDATSSWPYYATVRQAQDNVATKLKAVGIFDTAGFETDGSHYLSSGYVKIGTQFANQLMITISNNTTEITPQSFTDGLPSPMPTFVDNYNQTFDANFLPNAGVNFPAFGAQWQAVDGVDGSEIQSAAGDTYFQFAWPAKRILISNLQYVAPYTFTTKIAYPIGSTNGGVIIRAASNGSPDDLQETSAGEPGFNRAAIAFYPTDDGTSMNVKFSGAITAPFPVQPTPANQTPATIFAVPMPTGSNARTAGGGTLRIEDYGTVILAYYNSLPLVRIELSGFNGLVYTSGTVYDGSLNYLGKFSGKIVEYAGKVAVVQRNAPIRLYSAVTKLPASNPSSFAANKPATTWATNYHQTFSGTWDGATFNNQWDTMEPGAFTSLDATNSYLDFTWTAKRIIVSKNNYSNPYTFEIDFNGVGRLHPLYGGGMVLRAFSSSIVDMEYLEDTNAEPGYNRAGIAIYSNADGSVLNIQFSGIFAGTSTAVTTIAVPKPAGISSFLTRGTLRVEDFGSKIYVYYNSIAVARIDLSGLSSGVYSAGTVYNADMQAVGVFTGKEVLATGKVAVSQRASEIKLYSAKIENGTLITSYKEAQLSAKVYQLGSSIFIESGIQRVSIYNVQGKMVYSNNSVNGKGLTIENHFSKGIYLVKTENANLSQTSKLVVK